MRSITALHDLFHSDEATCKNELNMGNEPTFAVRMAYANDTWIQQEVETCATIDPPTNLAGWRIVHRESNAPMDSSALSAVKTIFGLASYSVPPAAAPADACSSLTIYFQTIHPRGGVHWVSLVFVL